MRILALVTDAFGGYGGIAQYNRDFLSALSMLPNVERIDILPRLAPDLVAQTPPKIHQWKPLRHRIPYSVFSMIGAMPRPEVIFCGHLYHGPLALLLARLSSARLISQLHGEEVWTPLSLMNRRSLERSDRVLCVSGNTQKRYISQGIDRDNSIVLPNSVGEDFVPGDRASARSRFNLAGEKVILTVARLDAQGYKGHDRIIPLIPQLQAGGHDVVYLIAGEGDDKARLEKIAQDHNAASSVRFLGNVPRSDLPDLYRASDLFALPSTGEGFGIVFLEAMGCGTPAIGLAAGGAPDALQGLGICVSEDGFPKALADALLAPRPDPVSLSKAVHARFGFAAFRERVGQMAYQLMRCDLKKTRERPD